MRRFTIVALAVLSLAAGCSKNVTTGRYQYAALSRDQEIRIGTEEQPKMVQEYGGKLKNEQINAYVTEIGAKLAANTEGDNPSLPWEFTVLDSEIINAFALPGGKVFMSRGLSDMMTNEAQLAGVLGHEVGHVTARHTSERFGQANVVSGVGTALGALLGEGAAAQAGAVAVQYGGQAILLKYSRGQEIEADELGMRYMAKCGYDPRGQLQVMEILDKASEGRESGLLESFFASHPDPKERISIIEGKLKGEFANTQNNPQYQLFADRYKQRYLSLRKAELEARPARTLAAVGAASWCTHCAMNEAQVEFVQAAALTMP